MYYAKLTKQNYTMYDMETVTEYLEFETECEAVLFLEKNGFVRDYIGTRVTHVQQPNIFYNSSSRCQAIIFHD